MVEISPVAVALEVLSSNVVVLVVVASPGSLVEDSSSVVVELGETALLEVVVVVETSVSVESVESVESATVSVVWDDSSVVDSLVGSVVVTESEVVVG